MPDLYSNIAEMKEAHTILSFFGFWNINFKYTYMENPFEIINAKLSAIEQRLEAIELNTRKEMETKKPENKIMAVQEVSEYLKLQVPTIYSKCSRGEIPYMKVGKRLYFNLEEINDWLKKYRVKTYAEIEDLAEEYLSKSKYNRR